MFKLKRTLSRRRTAAANATVSGMSAHLQNDDAEDVEEYLYSKRSDYAKVKVMSDDMFEESEDSQSSVEDTEVQSELDSWDVHIRELERDLKQKMLELPRGESIMSHRFVNMVSDDSLEVRFEELAMSMLQSDSESITTPVEQCELRPATPPSRKLLGNDKSVSSPENGTKKNMVAPGSLHLRQTVHTKKRRVHESKFTYLLYEIIKCKYIQLEDTVANRIILREHLVQWYDKRTYEHFDVRRRDVIRHTPAAIALFFVPNVYEIEAARIGDCEEALSRYFEMGNPTLFQRAVYAIDSLTWKRWYYTPRGGGAI